MTDSNRSDPGKAAGVPKSAEKAPAASGDSGKVSEVPRPSEKAPATSWFTLSNIKDVLAAVQAVATIAALIAGGLWFFRQRELVPNMKIEHHVSHVFLSPATVLLSVDVEISNVGKVLIPSLCGYTQPLQVFPVSSGMGAQLKTQDPKRRNFNWDPLTLPRCEGDYSSCAKGEVLSCTEAESGEQIEPGEIDAIHYEFVIPRNITTVAIYSFFQDTSQTARTGWQRTTLYKIDEATNH